MSLTKSATRWLGALLAGAVVACAAGCASGGDGGGAADTRVTGQAVAGAVDGTVTVRDAAGRTVATGAVAAGEFALNVPDEALAGTLDFEVTGTYTDEVSGAPVPLTTGSPLAARVEVGRIAAGQGGNVPVTPDTCVLRELVRAHGLSASAAETAFQSALGYLPDAGARPFDPAATDGATAAARPLADRDAAFRVGALSQFASDLGVTGDAIAGLCGALAADLADGALDGLGGGVPVVVGGVDLAALHDADPLPARLLTAYGAFAGRAGAGANLAALAAPSTGLPAMTYDPEGAGHTVATLGGRLVTVRLETAPEAPFAAGFWTARVAHRVTLTDVLAGTPVDVTTDPGIVGLSQHPGMHMLSGMDHATPMGIQADMSGAAGGAYVFDAYYVMASEMAMGAMTVPMGVWEYVVRIDEDTDGDGLADLDTGVVFHPRVRMPMNGDLLFALGGNPGDTWTTMTGLTQPRPYQVWLHQARAEVGGTHAVTLFVSTRDMADMAMGGAPGMAMGGMSFPAVYAGRTLRGAVNGMGMRPEATVAAVALEVSTDGGNTWVPLAETAPGTGLYAATGLAGLDNAAGADSLAVRLAVDLGAGANPMKTAGGADLALRFTAPGL